MLKTLIVGCGNIAGGFDASRPADAPPLTHAGAYRAHGGYELSACVEPDGTKLREFVNRWGIARGAAAAVELRGEQFEVVSICSPTDRHHEDVVFALSLRPRLIFCEKPLAMSAAQGEDLVRRCRAQGVLLAVNHNRRWDAQAQQVRNDITAGRWGRLRGATGVYNKGVVNNGSHMIDLLHMLAGPLELLHTGAPRHDYSEGDPSVPALLMATSAGAPVTLNCGHASDYSLFELQLILEQGTIAMEDGGLRWRVREAGPSAHFSGYRALQREVEVPGRYLGAMSAAAANIYDAVMRGAPLSSTGETALAAQHLCEQILRGAATLKSRNTQ